MNNGNFLTDITDSVEGTFQKWFGHWRNHVRKDTLRQYTLKLDQGNNASTDASGNLEMSVYLNRSMRNMIIGRVMVWANGYTPASPWSNSATWGGIFSGFGQNLGTMKDYFPYTSGAACLPNVSDYSGINGLRFERNEEVVFVLKSGPTSTNINVRIFGFLEPIDTDFEL